MLPIGSEVVMFYAEQSVRFNEYREAGWYIAAGLDADKVWAFHPSIVATTPPSSGWRFAEFSTDEAFTILVGF